MRASTRWSRLVAARLAEMEELCPGSGVIGARYWNGARARRFPGYVAGRAERDPLFTRMRRASGRRTTVLDVGAGPGRFSLALAPHVARVVAVDASPAMVRLLTRRARELGRSNIRTVTGRWEEVEVEPADVVVCSYVLPLIADAASFLRKLDGACRRRAFVYLNAASPDHLFDPLWRHFHGSPRRPAPTYLDAVAVLSELGIRAEVEVVELPTRGRYATLDAAVKAYRDQLCLPDEAPVRRELRGLLSSFLVLDGGELRAPVRTTPAAIVSWTPRHQETRPSV
jgi:SAM-dependent methyltransferase